MRRKTCRRFVSALFEPTTKTTHKDTRDSQSGVSANYVHGGTREARLTWGGE